MKRRYILYGILSVAMFIWNIITPLNGDVMVSFAGSFQADYLGKFPFNVYHSWNLRGIGYKYIIYFLYKFCSIFSNIASLSFQVWVKFVYYLIFIISSYVFFKLLKPRLSRLKLNWIDIYFIFLISIFSVSYFLSMQPEEYGILFTLGMISFALSEKKWLNLLSGAFIPLLLSLKIVTIAFVGFPTLILIYIWSKNYDIIKRYVASCVIFTIITVIFYVLYIPGEISDIKNATLFQSSFQLKIASFLKLGIWFVKSMSHAGCILVGLLGFFILLYQNRKRFNNLILIFGLFAIPALLVLVQNRFSVYHYLAFIPAAFIAIVMVLYSYQESGRHIKFQNVIVSIIAFIWISCTVFNIKLPIKDSKSSNIWYINTTFNPQVGMMNEINSKFHLSSQSSILCLTSGFPSYFIPAKSYLRYFFPLPLKRVTENPKLKESKIYKETLEESLTYHGEYIIYQPYWFDLKNAPALEAKIANEYELVYQKVLPQVIDNSLNIYKIK